MNFTDASDWAMVIMVVVLIVSSLTLAFIVFQIDRDMEREENKRFDDAMKLIWETARETRCPACGQTLADCDVNSCGWVEYRKKG